MSKVVGALLLSGTYITSYNDFENFATDKEENQTIPFALRLAKKFVHILDLFQRQLEL
jgi:hypothetical protein